MCPLFVRNAKQLITLKGSSTAPLKKEKMRELHIIENGSVWIEEGRIVAVGTDQELCKQFQAKIDKAEIVDATGKTVMPGFVDPHTHLVYAGSREKEFAMRLDGMTYMEIMNAGGGIYATTRATRKASEEELFIEGKKRLDQFLLHGVTTIEAKSGYGLNLKHELKQLVVAKKLHAAHPIDIISTFMGAHAIPVEFKDRPNQFVYTIVEEMIPEVKKWELAEFNDVFCDRGVFTPEQAKIILEAGKAYGLTPKIHADEIEPYGCAELAAEIGAISADHLLCVSDEGIKRMAEKGVIAVLLPGTAFFLMKEAANGRKMIDAGVPIALATDYNPGSSPTVSLPLIMLLGCLHMGMTPEEVIVAVTINAAHSIRRGHEIGSIEAGKKADMTIFNVSNYIQLIYYYGMNHAETVIKNGQVVVAKGQLCY
ncbi:imidazolonepropionase [Anoxybacillus sp. B7M1]|uniref:imidazolonepropionase n=1 Tax=unclassified Anoxybacillus TaxID=2639704 RepID=UPI0005CD808E|nr:MULTISPECIES: imidazolonepropionase [unclassified Anoxybacillus]ANB56585.1 imidazolonepropionase [Anoxybacillus sp. B2M1]ANB66064.1 imidazolonepropionase [Anoxybacillus sp. B7M1]KXG09712.1 Imidazolonepropionase [Anoxybacillus sp. P3H1B]